MEVFQLDGKTYNVSVTALQRKFSVLDTDQAGRTQNGHMYRDPIGTYYNYSMTVEQQGSDGEALEKFWDVISRPEKSHLCKFPYNQTTLTQRMYVTGGEQELLLLRRESARWGAITVDFIAMEPKVTP